MAKQCECKCECNELLIELIKSNRELVQAMAQIIDQNNALMSQDEDDEPTALRCLDD